MALKRQLTYRETIPAILMENKTQYTHTPTTTKQSIPHFTETPHQPIPQNATSYQLVPQSLASLHPYNFSNGQKKDTVRFMFG